jgi:hypothetical protein
MAVGTRRLRPVVQTARRSTARRCGGAAIGGCGNSTDIASRTLCGAALMARQGVKPATGARAGFRIAASS